MVGAKSLRVTYLLSPDAVICHDKSKDSRFKEQTVVITYPIYQPDPVLVATCLGYLFSNLPLDYYYINDRIGIYTLYNCYGLPE